LCPCPLSDTDSLVPRHPWLTLPPRLCADTTCQGNMFPIPKNTANRAKWEDVAVATHMFFFQMKQAAQSIAGLLIPLSSHT
jgi:hypothetical protein